MTRMVLGIIGGGQLGSMLASAAKKIDIKTIIISDDPSAPAQKFCDEFLYSNYDNEIILNKFVEKSDIITFEFENIPFNVLNKINEKKKFYQNHR